MLIFCSDFNGVNKIRSLTKEKLEAAGNAIRTGVRQTKEFAQDHPFVSGIATGAAGALGIRSLIKKYKG